MALNKFEKLIEYVVANDEKKARQLFHSIVVDKSRKIYEDLDMDVDTSRNFDEVESDETAHEMDEFGGDEQDDLKDDVLADTDSDLEGEEELTPEVDDRLTDLENEFDALKAEFDELQPEDGEDYSLDTESDFEDDEDLDDTEDLDGDFEDEDEFSDESETETESDEDGDEVETETETEDETEEEEEEPVDESVIREYVEKVTKGLASSTEEASTQKRSPVAGKNEIVKGITPKNIAQAGNPEKGRPTPISGKFTPDVVNVPGGKAKLKPAPKASTKEAEGINKKSNL